MFIGRFLMEDLPECLNEVSRIAEELKRTAQSVPNASEHLEAVAYINLLLRQLTRKSRVARSLAAEVGIEVTDATSPVSGKASLNQQEVQRRPRNGMCSSRSFRIAAARQDRTMNLIRPN